ncbi:unnamed protein product [Rangifer tarandus platyrhynchus]|uniref:Uncharacterized protein n=2 Tax=Rangifer tarandus platyrhynchus TaxID=3082113 RepID=A0ACB0DPP6_RANTA|nr:unnamed protein product [Rangifer tarandus platyrhynchus]CAI9690202.1 unnamed protein product [Rangifer tarandus platyrhynchus]
MGEAHSIDEAHSARLSAHTSTEGLLGVKLREPPPGPLQRWDRCTQTLWGQGPSAGWGQAQAETLSSAERRARAGANSHRAASEPPPTERRGAGSVTTWGAGRCSHAGGSPEVAQSPAELSSARRESASPRL